MPEGKIPMKHPFLASIQLLALVVSGYALDASVLDQRIWTELRYRTVRYVSMIEPEARKVLSRFW
jgi:hypothetical protein